MRFAGRDGCAPAFTLIELLVVIAVVGLLAGMLIPVVQRGLASAHAATCSGNARVLIKGVLDFAADHKGMIPYSQMRWYDDEGNLVHSKYWYTAIEPYTGIASEKLKCPEKRKTAFFDYAWSFPNLPYTDQREGHAIRRRLAYWRRPGLVMLFGCNGPFWGVPRKWIYSPVDYPGYWNDGETGGVGSYHNEGSIFAFLDGHVEWRAVEAIRDPLDPYVRQFWGENE